MSDQMVVLETEVPQDIYMTLQASGLFRPALAEQSRRLLASDLFQRRTLSLGQAAKLAGMDRWGFIEYLADNQVSVLALTEEELAREFAVTDALAKELSQ